MDKPDPAAKSKGSKGLLFRSRIHLSVTILTAFTALLVFTVLSITFYSYKVSSNSVLKMSEQFVQVVNELIQQKVNSFLSPAATMVKLNSCIIDSDICKIEDEDMLESLAIEVISTYPQLMMLNIGFENGNFLMPKKMPDGTISTKRIHRSGPDPVVIWTHHNKDGSFRDSETSHEVKYDPRTRPWYKGAIENRGHFWSSLYIMFTDGKPGITSSYPIKDENGEIVGVMGIDIELAGLSLFLKSLNVGQHGVVAIINSNHEVVAFPDTSLIVKRAGSTLRVVTLPELGVPQLEEAYEQYQGNQTNRFSFLYEGTQYIASFAPLLQETNAGWMTVFVAPEDDFIGFLKDSNRMTFIISITILFIGMLLTTFISRGISVPIIRLAERTREIRDFHLDHPISINSRIREIQIMREALASMQSGLFAFQKYVPAALVRQLISTGEEARIGGQNRRVSIFFSDIVSFTSISESMTPDELVLQLSTYFEELTGIIMKENGTIDKYIGDAIMAFWGAPKQLDNHAYYACLAAIQCQKTIAFLNQQWQSQGKKPFHTRIGINTGTVTIGNIGSSERMNYTLVGDSANLASRLEGINKYYGTSIIISEATYEEIAGSFLCRLLDVVSVRGKKEGTRILELIAINEDNPSPELIEFCGQHTKAVELYLQREWETALGLFRVLEERSPEDVPIKLFIERCEQFLKAPPDASWNGIYSFQSSKA